MRNYGSEIAEICGGKSLGDKSLGDKVLSKAISRRDRGAVLSDFVNHGLLIGAACAVLLCSTDLAHSGPCTAQIAQLEQQINAGTGTGPTGPQTLGAQLGHQPTPRDVEHAEHVANADADAALDRARKADSDGNTDQCNSALTEARRLYGIY